MPQSAPLMATLVGMALPAGSPAWMAGLIMGLSTMVLPSQKSSPVNALDPGMQVNFSDTQAPIPIGYGRNKAGGNQVYKGVSGENDKYLNIVQTISEGEIDAVEAVYLNDKNITEYGSKAYYELFTGTADQTVCTSLQAQDANWKNPQRHTAYIYVRLEYDREIFPSLPVITVLFRGLKVYDPRTSTTVWSQNPALCTYNYVLNDRYGVGILSDFWSESNICDAANWFDSKGYTLNCLISQQEPSIDIAMRMLASVRATMRWSEDIFNILPLDYDTPVITLTEDDIKANSFDCDPPGIADLPNAVRLKYHNKDNNYVEDDLVCPDTAAINLDGEVREHVVPIMTTDYTQVAKIGAYEVDRRRLNNRYRFIGLPKAYPLEPGDMIKMTHSDPGWTEKVVRVEDAQPLGNHETALVVVEENAALYDDTVNITTHTMRTTTLPDPLKMPPPVSSVQFSEEVYAIKDNTYVRIKISWSPPPNYPFLDHVEIWASQSQEGPYVHYGKETGSFTFHNAKDGEAWYFKLLSVSTYGVKMGLSGAAVYNYTVAGKTSVPADVTGFMGSVAGDTVHLRWEEVAITDLLGYEIRLNSAWGASLFFGFTKAQFYSLVGIKPGDHTFLIKAKDTLGNYSETAALKSVTVFDPPNYTEKHSFSNDFTSGTFNNTERYNDPTYGYVLRVIHTGGLSGDYTSPMYDMGSVKKCRHWLDFETVILGSGAAWENVFSESDTWEDIFSPAKIWIEVFGNVQAGTLAIVFYYSEDDITYYDIDNFQLLSCEVQARYIKYKIFITDSTQDSHIYVKSPVAEKAYYWQ